MKSRSMTRVLHSTRARSHSAAQSRKVDPRAACIVLSIS